MGRTRTSEKATKTAPAKRTPAKAKPKPKPKPKAKAKAKAKPKPKPKRTLDAKKKTPVAASPSRGIGIGKKKASTAGAPTKRRSAAAKKVTKKTPPPPMPEGWPVSSALSYPAPRAAVVMEAAQDAGLKEEEHAAKKQDAMDASSDSLNSLNSDSSDDEDAPAAAAVKPNAAATHAPANYLTPGSLLQQSCNGSDVFLRKRAEHSNSTAFPSVAAGESGAGAAKGGPTRFLIIWPGRLSLKVPPPPKAGAGDGAVEDGKGGDNGASKDEERNGGGEKDSETDGEKPVAKKRCPFAPSHPPQLLGKLLSLGGGERRMEMRIPFPSSDGSNDPNPASNGNSDGPSKQLVMSGRAVPLTGKYMALSFKRTGGTKDSSSSTPKNKKRGTGSIICKDVFRSVIVLGKSELLEDGMVVEAKPIALDAVTGKKGDNDSDDGEEEKLGMKHYGGSARTLDGGGRYVGGATGRKSWKGAAAARHRSVEVASCREPDKSDASNCDDESSEDVVEDVRSSDAGSDEEFVPAAARKKRSKAPLKGRSVVGMKRKAEVDLDGAEDRAGEAAPVRKRTSRRSAAKANNVCYVDDDSDVDMEGSSGSDEGDEEGSGDDSDPGGDEEEEFKPKGRARVRAKKPAKKVSEKKPAAKADSGPAKRARGRSAAKVTKSYADESSDEDMGDPDSGEEEGSEDGKLYGKEEGGADEPKGKPKLKKPVVTKTSAKTKNGRTTKKKVSSNKDKESEESSKSSKEEELLLKTKGKEKKPASKAATKKSRDSTATMRKGAPSGSDNDKEGSDESRKFCDAEKEKPAAAKKKRNKSASANSGCNYAVAKRKVNKGESDDDDESEVLAAPLAARKRAPRRSVAKATNVSYVDEESDVEIVDLSDSEDDEESGSETKGKQQAKKKPGTKAATKAPANKKNRASAFSKNKSASMKNAPSDRDAKSDTSSKFSDGEEELKPKAVSIAKKSAAKAAIKPKAKGKTTESKQKSTSAENVESDESSKFSFEDEEIKPKEKAKSKIAAGGKSAAKTEGAKTIKQGPSTPTRKKNVPKINRTPISVSKPSGIIEINIDGGDIPRTSKQAKKIVMKPSPAISSLSKSPISRGRRKKNSPIGKKNPGKENDLNLDDDGFDFL